MTTEISTPPQRTLVIETSRNTGAVVTSGTNYNNVFEEIQLPAAQYEGQVCLIEFSALLKKTVAGDTFTTGVYETAPGGGFRDETTYNPGVTTHPINGVYEMTLAFGVTHTVNFFIVRASGTGTGTATGGYARFTLL